VTAEGQAELLRETLRIAPGLGSATVVETRVGFRPRSADDRPIVGPLPGSSNTFIATGLGALGLTLGPYVGAQAAAMATGAAAASVLAPFSPARFGTR
jgi:D-amino-acid dehydrogenase